MPDGRSWPRFTVVTPSYNQAQYIEETIRSVLLQGYPDLEYIVIDGGSTDESAELIERYSPWLTYWVSEQDKGQSDAINKGFLHGTGDVQAWLNSDDVYYPDALRTGVVELIEADADVIIGAMNKVYLTDGEPEIVRRTSGAVGTPIHAYPIFKDEAKNQVFHYIQPPMFWKGWLWTETNGLDPDFDWVMDIEWCTRALEAGAAIRPSNSLYVRFLLHATSKTVMFNHKQHREQAAMYRKLAFRSGYRTGACLLAALRSEAIASSIEARALTEQGQAGAAFSRRLRSTVFRQAARLFPPRRRVEE